MTVAVTFKLWGVIVVNSRVTYRTANDTRFNAGEADTLGKVNRQGSDNVPCDHTRQRGTSPSHSTVLSPPLYAHVKVEVSFETARYPSAQNTTHVSPMEAPPQLEFTPTPLWVRVSGQSVCEHDGETVCASLTYSPDERQRKKDVVEILPSA